MPREARYAMLVTGFSAAWGILLMPFLFGTLSGSSATVPILALCFYMGGSVCAVAIVSLMRRSFSLPVLPLTFGGLLFAFGNTLTFLSAKTFAISAAAGYLSSLLEGIGSAQLLDSLSIGRIPANEVVLKPYLLEHAIVRSKATA